MFNAQYPNPLTSSTAIDWMQPESIDKVKKLYALNVDKLVRDEDLHPSEYFKSYYGWRCRTDPHDPYEVPIELPCDMKFHEKLLLPNMADESAVLTTHIAKHYYNLPDALILLHGGSLKSWHCTCRCSTAQI